MSRHTIGNKRGSVRGAPPGVYMGFATFHKNESEEEDAMRPVVRFFGFLFKGAALFLIVIFSLIVVYAFREP